MRQRDQIDLLLLVECVDELNEVGSCTTGSSP
jgi:hypothetical protein